LFASQFLKVIEENISTQCIAVRHPWQRQQAFTCIMNVTDSYSKFRKIPPPSRATLKHDPIESIAWLNYFFVDESAQSGCVPNTAQTQYRTTPSVTASQLGVFSHTLFRGWIRKNEEMGSTHLESLRSAVAFRMLKIGDLQTDKEQR